MAKTTSRLSRVDWADGALEVLIRDGVAGVRINSVCEHLGVTRGSFYWHFDDLAALHQAMAERWSEQRLQAHRELEELHRLPAAARLQEMTMQLIDDRSYDVERALREFARTDKAVSETIAQGDLFVFEVVHGALLELGERPDNARVLAGLLTYAGIGFATGSAGLPRPKAAEFNQLLSRLIG